MSFIFHRPGEVQEETTVLSVSNMMEKEDLIAPTAAEEEEEQPEDQENQLEQEQEEEHDPETEGETAMQVMDDEEDVVKTQDIDETEGETAVIPSKSRNEIKHPMTSWTIFGLENRESIAKEHPHLGMTDIGKLLSEKYRSLSAEEKERLDQKAKADKLRYLSELEHVRNDPPGTEKNSGSNNGGGKSATDFIIPVGRVRKIVKLDKDVKNVSKEAYVAITKTTELFIAYMSVRCARTASQRGVRTIRDQDVVQTVHTQNNFDFLRLDFPKTQVTKKTAPTTSRQSVSKKAALASSADNSNSSKPASIKYFFGPTVSSVPADTVQDDEEQETALDENHNNDDSSYCYQEQLPATTS